MQNNLYPGSAGLGAQLGSNSILGREVVGAEGAQNTIPNFNSTNPMMPSGAFS